MADFDVLRRRMVDGQIRVADVTDRGVLAAFLAVPREKFIPEAQADLAYLDMRPPLGVAGRAALDPMTLAKLVQLAEPAQGERVLVVGCGLGYTAALFAELGARVVALEADPTLAAGARERLAGYDHVTIAEGPLPAGAPAHAPYDLIFLDGAAAGGLEPLIGQLAPAGRLVAPLGADRATKATVLRPSQQSYAAATFFDAYGPPLPGFEQVHTFAF
jgi:protein-L-isoaspartate(D-aspartate) O-methyltransferase